MDLYKEWETVNQTKFKNTQLTKQEIMKAIEHESKSNLEILKHRLRIKMYWMLSFTVITAVWMLISLQKTELLLILSVFLFFNGLQLVLILINLDKLSLGIALSSNTLHVFKSNVTVIKRILRTELIIGSFGMPCSVLSGSLVMNNYLGYSLNDFANNPRQLVTVVVCLIVFVPLGIVAGLKMNEKAFGKDLKRLQENILQLEAVV
jgi:hypothetical protein